MPSSKTLEPNYISYVGVIFEVSPGADWLADNLADLSLESQYGGLRLTLKTK